MKRLFVLFVLLFSVLFFSGTMYGADITAQDGTVYKNIEVLNTTPDGILASFIGKNGYNTVELIKIKDLPVAVQKKYGYVPKKAISYEKEHLQWLKNQHALTLKEKKMAEERAKRHQEKLDIKPINKTAETQQQEKEKMDGLVNKLDGMPGNKKQTGDEGGFSVGNLMHDITSSTEKQTKEIDNLTK